MALKKSPGFGVLNPKPATLPNGVKKSADSSPIVFPVKAAAGVANSLIRKIIERAITKHGNDAMKVGDQVARDVAESIKVPKRSSAGLEPKTIRTDPASNASVSRSGSKTIVTTTSPKAVKITTPARSVKQQAATDATLMAKRASAINNAGSSAYNAAAPVIAKASLKAGAKGVVAGVVGSQVVDKGMNKLNKKGK